MAPDNLRFGGGAADTILHPIIALLLMIAAILILVLPRNKAIAPFLLAFFTIPLGQVVVVAGVHFPVLRILIMTVLLRMLAMPSGGRKLAGGFNALDRIVILWAIATAVTFLVQYPEMGAIIRAIGDTIDTIGGYLAVRYLIPDRLTVTRAITALAAVCVIQGVFMISEQVTHQNVMAFAGAEQPKMREGRLRSEGTMGTLYGGTFAGALIPIFVSRRKERQFRLTMLAGLAGAMAMVVASHASTSVLALNGGVLGLVFWPLRKSMKSVRRTLTALLIGLHLLMNGPVWSLIARADIFGGSNGYQRYALVDTCIRHFRDWWLVGYKDYPSWGFGMWDLCNQFVAVALTGGLATLILYIMIFTRSLSALGRTRKAVEADRGQEWFLWCTGSTFVAMIVSSFGINYMLQLKMCLFPMVAITAVSCFVTSQAAGTQITMLHDEVESGVAAETMQVILP